jgi:hypothetical protein
VAALGRASGPGRAALLRGRDELRALAAGARKAPVTGEILGDLLRDLGDPRRSVETDQRAARSCANRTLPCWSTGRKAPTGFSGLESLLNYTRYQAGALNQFDELGHILQFNVFSGATGPCDEFNARPDVPARGGGRTTEILAADPCVGWLGPNQPDVSFDQGLPPYHPSVCPQGSTHPAICDPGTSTGGASARREAGGSRAAASATGPAADRAAGAPPAADEQAAGVVPPAAQPPDSLEDVLELPGGGTPGGGAGAAQELLDFLFGI